MSTARQAARTGGTPPHKLKATPPSSSFIPRFLLRESIVAGPNYNRWLFPPAALLVHFAIGQAYAYSVFNKPLMKLCPKHSATCVNWDIVQVTWVFTLMFIFLGSSAALFGRRLETLGPRFAACVAALCWGLGYVVAAFGVRHHTLWLVYLGNGAIGGLGLGLGYISPVSTLMKWFPDRRGMATGMAIAGFGGGAVIGSPLSALLMQHYPLWKVFMILGGVYTVAMLVGGMAYRVPPPGWRPHGFQPDTSGTGINKAGYVDANRAILTPHFWLLWVILCANVSAGIGIISQLSPIVQDIFKGRVTPLEAAGIVGLFSLFNIFGRLFWSSISDLVGRWGVYTGIFVTGMGLYACVPVAGHAGNFAAFFVCVAVIVSMYGGGFAAIPAYISDMFGIKHAGAIHGRVLTAWSAAAVLGPYLISSIKKQQVAAGKAVNQAYDKTLHILVLLLAIGLCANCLLGLVMRRFPLRRVVDEEEEEINVEGKREEEKEEEKEHVAVVARLEAGHSNSNGHGTKRASDHVGHAGGPLVALAVGLWWCVPLAAFGWGLFKVMATGIKAFH